MTPKTCGDRRVSIGSIGSALSQRLTCPRDSAPKGRWELFREDGVAASSPRWVWSSWRSGGCKEVRVSIIKPGGPAKDKRRGAASEGCSIQKSGYMLSWKGQEQREVQKMPCSGHTVSFVTFSL